MLEATVSVRGGRVSLGHLEVMLMRVRWGDGGWWERWLMPIVAAHNYPWNLIRNEM